MVHNNTKLQHEILDVKCFYVDNSRHYTTIRDILKKIQLLKKQVKK